MRFAEGSVVLKRFLLIFSDLIFDSKVDPGKPSLAASFRGSSGCLFGSLARGCRKSQLSSTEKFSISHTITDRSMTFCNSRILPGQEYACSRSRLFLFTA